MGPGRPQNNRAAPRDYARCVTGLGTNIGEIEEVSDEHSGPALAMQDENVTEPQPAPGMEDEKAVVLGPEQPAAAVSTVEEENAGSDMTTNAAGDGESDGPGTKVNIEFYRSKGNCTKWKWKKNNKKCQNNPINIGVGDTVKFCLKDGNWPLDYGYMYYLKFEREILGESTRRKI